AVISPTVAVSMASAAASGPSVGSGAPGSANCTIRPPTSGSSAQGTNHELIPSPVATASNTTVAGAGRGTRHTTCRPSSSASTPAVTSYIRSPPPRPGPCPRPRYRRARRAEWGGRGCGGGDRPAGRAWGSRGPGRGAGAGPAVRGQRGGLRRDRAPAARPQGRPRPGSRGLRTGDGLLPGRGAGRRAVLAASHAAALGRGGRRGHDGGRLGGGDA